MKVFLFFLDLLGKGLRDFVRDTEEHGLTLKNSHEKAQDWLLDACYLLLVKTAGFATEVLEGARRNLDTDLHGIYTVNALRRLRCSL